MDEVMTVDAWEYGCMNAMAFVAFCGAVGYIVWWLYTELKEF